jgi:hypothetical protein
MTFIIVFTYTVEYTIKEQFVYKSDTIKERFVYKSDAMKEQFVYKSDTIKEQFVYKSVPTTPLVVILFIHEECRERWVK